MIIILLKLILFLAHGNLHRRKYYIISCPFGSALLNGKKGDKLEFTINDRVYNFTVENIGISEYIEN